MNSLYKLHGESVRLSKQTSDTDRAAASKITETASVDGTKVLKPLS